MFELPKLEYEYKAFEPYIDAKTMEIHYSKHHQGYVDKLNAALEGLPKLQSMPVEELLANLNLVDIGKKDAVRNNGGGHANHTLFWSILKPGGVEMSAKFKKVVEDAFGSVEKLVAEVSDAAATQFGSGWGWLVVNKEGKLEAVSTPNQDSPLLHEMTPILGIDVWEHAYYLNYQNRRPDYIKAVWNLVDWSEVERRYMEVVS